MDNLELSVDELGLLVLLIRRLIQMTDLRLSIDHTPRYFQHVHFIPIVGVGKRGAY